MKKTAAIPGRCDCVEEEGHVKKKPMRKAVAWIGRRRSKRPNFRTPFVNTLCMCDRND
jgi:hypothetical protein